MDGGSTNAINESNNIDEIVPKLEHTVVRANSKSGRLIALTLAGRTITSPSLNITAESLKNRAIHNRLEEKLKSNCGESITPWF